MPSQRIAIIGLGRIGSAFLRQMLSKQANGIELICVSEVNDTPGRNAAIEAGLTLKSLDEVVAMSAAIDVIFDLTGLPSVRRELREKLSGAGNQNTVIASESIARLIWSLITDETLPVIEGRVTGY